MQMLFASLLGGGGGGGGVGFNPRKRPNISETPLTGTYICTCVISILKLHSL